jgi:hypothetical protein
MARNVQSQSGRPGTGRTFLGLLINAIFWLVMATVLPVQAIARAIPEAASLIQWAPMLFYLLALWSFIRAVRTLQRLAGGRARTLFRPQASGGAQKQGPAGVKQVKTKTGLPVTRTPTVQRMR